MIEHPLPEQIDIRRIAELHQTLGEMLSSADTEVTLDASAVTRIDTAGVQLLAAALRIEGGERVVLSNPSPCITEAFQNLGLAHLLD